jgi:hypothetical protein
LRFVRFPRLISRDHGDRFRDMTDTLTDVTADDFGVPVKIDSSTKPAGRGRPPGASNAETAKLERWLNLIEAADRDEYEMASRDADGAHPIARLNSLRRVAKRMGGFAISSAVVGEKAAKRVRIFAKRTHAPNLVAVEGNGTTEPATEAKPKATKKAAAAANA